MPKSKKQQIHPMQESPPPPQHQELPGQESKMVPAPIDEDPRYQGSGKLAKKVALITGGDSGIGRAVAIAFAKEGADLALVYLNEEEDAEFTRHRAQELGRDCIKISGDVGDEEFTRRAVAQTVQKFGHLDILVNNAAEQQVTHGIEEIDDAHLERTIRTNLFGYFHMTKAALPHLKEGDAIINTTSIQAYEPKPGLMDYATTKAAILNLTRSLAKELSPRGIRVNGVAPGPVWTPLIPASYPSDKLPEFGKDTPMKRPAQPAEIAPSYVFLASDIDSSYMTGQVLHPNGGSGMYS
ncbi:MAG: short-chain dehydrogenase/reductase [Pedosphaera sp.]|nr:short-chain dehydrogenase/reductase [Pedosphaera sp.]